MQKKILVLVSNPKGTTNLELLPEIKRVKEALRRSQNRGRFVVEWEVAERQSDLRRHILDVKPSIIHFCGHGTEQGLVLEDETGRAKVVPNEVLTDLLKAFADRIECVLLNACDSENLADDLIQHLNYVIGMNQGVRDDAAIAFAEGFYDTLGAGESYERAFEIGKNAVLGKATLRHAPDAASRKATVVGQDGKPVKVQNREHLIPVLKINPNPTPTKPLWLAPEVERQVVRELLEAIESGFNTIKLFHTDEAIVLKDQYIPVQVTLERRYKHSVETLGGYAESEAELRRIYAMKGSSEEEIKEEIKRQQVDWEEARRQHSRIVVLADPGMGKSTLLRREVVTGVQEAYQALGNDKPLKEITIPLFIRLSTLAHKVMQMPMVEAILESIQEDELCYRLLRDHKDTEVMNFLNAFLKEQLLGGKGLLLLDALDEVPDGNRQKLLEKLNGFAKAYPTCPIVGTSRIVGYGGRLVDGAKDVEIVPFTQKQTEEYIEKWFEYAPLKDESVSARGLVQALRERPQLAGLAQNPLLLSLICSLYQQDYLALPVRRCQLYEQAVNYMLEHWITDNGRKRITDNDRQSTEEWIVTKKELLEELAYQFSCEGKQLFSFGELREKLKKYLKSENASDLEGVKAADLIKELCEQDGILQRWSAEDDRLPIERRRYLFLHRTFQEYLAASYLSKADEDEIEFEKLFWNYDWHETISLMAGLMYEPIDLIQRIINTKDDIFQTQLLLAGRCIAECGELFDSLVDEVIDRIYLFWLAYTDAEFIRSVVVAIGQTRTKLVQNIQVVLNDKNGFVGEDAAQLLGRIGSDKALDILIATLKDENSPTRWAIPKALGNIGHDKAVDALIAILNSEDRYFRESATEALGQIGSEKAVDALIAVFNHKKSYVISSAAKALGLIGSEKAADALITTLNNENSDVRVNVVVALGLIGSEKAVDALISTLNDEDSLAREQAVWTLGQINTEKAVNASIAALNHKDKNVRGTAAAALGRIGSEKAVDALITILNDENIYVRRNAVVALGQIGSEKAVDTLISTLSNNDEDSYLRNTTVVALGQIGSEKAVDALIAELNGKNRGIRVRAAEALGQIGSEKAVDTLITILMDKNSPARCDAARVLGQTGGERVVDALIAALTNEDKNVISSAAQSLGQIGSEKAVDALIGTLTDENSYVISSAAEALGQIGSEKAVDALISTLDNFNRNSRRQAAVEQVDICNSINNLIADRKDEDTNVVRSAVVALGQISSDKAVDTLIIALNDKNSGVKVDAVQALRQSNCTSCLEKLLQSANPNLIYRSDIFPLARSWAIRFIKSSSSCIPVYPELLPTPTTADREEVLVMAILNRLTICNVEQQL